MGDERHTMMLALDVDPMGGGDWRWRWYDHDSGRTLADGVEGDVVAAWRAATTHHVKSSNELLWSLDDRAEAAEQRAEAAERELAQARADRALLAGLWLGTVAPRVLPAILPTNPGDRERLVAALDAVDLPLAGALADLIEAARAEGEAAGAARERAAVVAYLRAHPSVAERRGGQQVDAGPHPAVARWVLRDAVPDIEAGEHVGAAGGAA